MAEIIFPKVEVTRQNGQKVPVHIYGFAHGIGIKGSELNREVGDALKREAASFGSHDCLAMEGTEEELLRHAFRAAGGKTRISISKNFIRNTLRKYLPHVVNTAEAIEHFELLRSIASDFGAAAMEKERELIKKAAVEKADKLVEVTGKTTITQKEMEQFKRDTIEELVEHGIGREKAGLYVESQYTFRSLLMARAAYHRVYATGLPVRLFVGFAHTHEIVDFLDQKKVDEYVKTLPEPLKKLYNNFEINGWDLVGMFEKHGHKFEPPHWPSFFRWMALKTAKALHEPNHSGTVVINVAEFRKAITRK